MEKLKVKDFASVTTGGTPSTKKKEYWDDGSIPWLNSGELNQDIITTTRNYITEEGLNNSAAKLMPEDTVLIALTGSTTGVVGYLTFKASANQSVTGILPSEKHVPKYLYYYLKSIRRKVISDAYGGAQPHISQGYVKELEIPLPPLPQQKKIAAILDAADEYRQKTKALIAKYDELTQSLFLDMFGDPVTNPKGWKYITLEESLEFLTSGSRGWAKYYSEDGNIFLRIQNVGYNELRLDELTYVNAPESAEARRTRVQEGDLLLTITADLGRTAIIPKGFPDANINQHLALIRLKKIYSPLFVSSYIASKGGQSKFLKLDKGGVKAGLNFNDIKSYKVFDVPFDLQLEYKNKYNAIADQKAQAQESLAKAEDLFNSLLQRAFKGELT